MGFLWSFLIWVGLEVLSLTIDAIAMNVLMLVIRVKCHFSSCGLSHFTSLVQMFYFSSMCQKRFHRCRFRPPS
ncbi:hypothetical protein Hanom_Chr05g00407071 [Helianthus anomalus]